MKKLLSHLWQSLLLGIAVLFVATALLHLCDSAGVTQKKTYQPSSDS